MSALFDRIGPASSSPIRTAAGRAGCTAIKNQNVRAIVAYEPGSGFVFPEGEVPPPMPSAAGTLEAVGVPLAEFMQLTRSRSSSTTATTSRTEPIDEPRPGQLAGAPGDGEALGRAVNRHGGDVTLVHLPEIGIRGNTHFPFSDLNNVEIADLMSAVPRTNKNLD